MISSAAAGLFQFAYSFGTADDPTFEYAGYLLGAAFQQLADTNGESGSVIVPVLAGETIGFRVGSFDNTGSPGILAITDFSAPANAPEPGTLYLTLAGMAVGMAGLSLRRRRFVWRTAACIGAIGGAYLLMSGSALAQSPNYTSANVTGVITRTTVVNLLQQAQTTAGAARSNGQLASPFDAEVPKFSNSRLRPPLVAPRGGSPVTSAQQLQLSSPSLSVGPASGVFGFNALSHYDQRTAWGGNQWSIEPPNQSIAVANSYLLEGVVDAVQIYNTSGAPALPVVLAANQVFGLAPTINRTTGVNGVFLVDMRVFFDQGIGRWFIVMRAQDNDAAGNPLNSSHLYIAESQTGDPTANYNVYVMDTTNVSHPGCPCLADYPQIGADQYGFHIAFNEFSTDTQQFVDASILSISKASLAAGVLNPVAYQFWIPYNTGFEFAIQPATTPPGAASFVGSGGLEYFVSTSNSPIITNQVGVWAVTNTSSLATLAPALGLVETTISTGVHYTSPDVASQPSGPTPYGTSQGIPLEFLDGGDPRVQALSYAGGRLYLTFQTGIYDQNQHFVVGGAYLVLSPTYRGGTLAAQVSNQGYLYVNGNHLLRPAIAVNAQGNGAIAVTLVGTAGPYFPSAAFIPFNGSSTPSSVLIAAAGALPEDGFSGYNDGGVSRWGDYNTAAAAADGTIWMVVQDIGNYVRTPLANWNTYVIGKRP